MVSIEVNHEIYAIRLNVLAMKNVKAGIVIIGINNVKKFQTKLLVINAQRIFSNVPMMKETESK